VGRRRSTRRVAPIGLHRLVLDDATAVTNPTVEARDPARPVDLRQTDRLDARRAAWWKERARFERTHPPDPSPASEPSRATVPPDEADAPEQAPEPEDEAPASSENG
jgi:hypothetical protein